MDKWRNWQTLKQEKWSAILLKFKACTIPGSNPGLSTNNNQIINLMANKRLEVITENVLRTRGIKVAEYPEEVSDGLDKMEIGQVFGLSPKNPNTLHSTISRKRRESWNSKEWKILGIDPLNKICFVKRTL